MIWRVVCPDCDRVQRAFPAAGRFLLECVRCGRYWSEIPPEDAEAHVPGCARHPRVRATHFCDACDGAHCEACAREDSPPGVDFGPSLCCRRTLHAIAQRHALGRLWTEPGAALRYPIGGAGGVTLAFVLAINLVDITGLVTPFLFAAWLAHVLRQSARPGDDAPGYPDVTSVADVIYPFFRLVAATFVAWGPALLYWRYVGGTGDVALLALAVAGAAVYPAMVMSSAVSESVAVALNPAVWIEVIRVLGGDYLRLLVALTLLGAAIWAVDHVPQRVILVGVFVRFVHLYLVTLAFHLMGRVVLHTRHRIDWSL